MLENRNGHINGQSETVEIVTSNLFHWVQDLRRHLARVTGVTGLYPKGENYDRWMATRGSYENAIDERDAKGREGRLGHDSVQSMIRGNRLKFKDFSLGLWKKLQGVTRFWGDHQPTVLASEEMIYDEELGVAGHFDHVVEMGERQAVLDLKFGNWIFEPAFLQVETYAQILERHYGYQNLLRCILHLTDKTKQGYSLRTWEKDDERFEVVKALKKVFDHLHGTEPRIERYPATLSLPNGKA